MQPAGNQLALNDSGVTPRLIDRLDRGEGGAHGRSNEQERLLGIEQSFGLVALSLQAEVEGQARVVVDRDVESEPRHHAIFGQPFCGRRDPRRRIDLRDNLPSSTGAVATIGLPVATESVDGNAKAVNA